MGRGLEEAKDEEELRSFFFMFFCFYIVGKLQAI
jgi:hypothetical protein